MQEYKLNTWKINYIKVTQGHKIVLFFNQKYNCFISIPFSTFSSCLINIWKATPPPKCLIICLADALGKQISYRYTQH